jgi:hypothetical protein
LGASKANNQKGKRAATDIIILILSEILITYSSFSISTVVIKNHLKTTVPDISIFNERFLMTFKPSSKFISADKTKRRASYAVPPHLRASQLHICYFLINKSNTQNKRTGCTLPSK